MIISFSVQNFGPIKECQTLSFEANKSSELEDHYLIQAPNGMRLLKIALIFGANASGKTTILRALDFLRNLVLQPARKKNDEIDFSPFLFDANTPDESSSFSIEFIQNGIRYRYEVELTKKAIIREELKFYEPNKATVFKRKTDLEKQFTEITFGSKIRTNKTFEKVLEANTLWNNTVLGGFLKTNIEINQLRDVLDWFSEYLSPIVGTKTNLEGLISSRIENSIGLKESVIEILRKADFHISDILFDDEKEAFDNMVREAMVAYNVPSNMMEAIRNQAPKKIELEHTVLGNSYSLPFELESEGTQRYYGFAGLLSILITRSTAISIDELEASLHPDLYIHFLLTFLLNSKKSQLIATTHNREILNNRDLFRNDAIWFTEKNANSATELYSLGDLDTSVVRDSTNVFNAYKSGKLGGIPNLGDYFVTIENEG